MCVATSVEELESLGAELALSAKHADQELSSLVGAVFSSMCLGEWAFERKPPGSCCA